MNGNLVSLLFSPKGRINRAKYWVISFCIYFIGILLYWGIYHNALDAEQPIIVMLLSIIFYPLSFYISIVTEIKRWHDRGKSGLWLFAALIPVVGQIWVFCQTYCFAGEKGLNRYGKDPLE